MKKRVWLILAIVLGIGVFVVLTNLPKKPVVKPAAAISTEPIIIKGNTPIQYDQLDPTTLNYKINFERASNGLAPLALNDKLSTSATNKCNDMVAKNYWSHNDPTGREPWHFFVEANYYYSSAGENLAYGFNDSTALVKNWMNSPSHRENILNNTYTEEGFAICYSNSFVNNGPTIIVVEHFGKPNNR